MNNSKQPHAAVVSTLMYICNCIHTGVVSCTLQLNRLCLFYFFKETNSSGAHRSWKQQTTQTAESNIHSNSITLYISFADAYRYTRSVLLCCYAAANLHTIDKKYTYMHKNTHVHNGKQ